MNNKLNLMIVISSVIMLSSCTSGEVASFLETTNKVLSGGKSNEIDMGFKPSKPDPKKEAEYEENRKKFKEKRDYWIGKSVDDLVRSWDAPDKTYQRTDGGKQYTWEWRQKDTPGLYAMSIECNTTFISNNKGIIKSWDYSGCFPHLKPYYY
ncbi:hypothetical protein [Morganella psychrotolerans]|uniref:hypothetical protein n=1 Tax=Morganella psychrotolerans TaxID=368603 RepID=UPI0039B09A77